MKVEEKALALIAAERKRKFVYVQEVVTTADYEAAGRDLLAIKDRANRYEAFLEPVIKPLKEALAAAKGLAANALTECAQIEDELRTNMSRYIEGRQVARQAAFKKALELKASGQEKKAVALIASSSAELPRVAGIALIDGTDFEVADESQIPEEFFTRTLNVKKVKEAIKNGEDVPGTIAVRKVSFRVTPSRAEP